MKGNGPDPYGPESSSSSTPIQYGDVTAEDFDGDDHADLSQDNALLADDPLDEGSGKVQYCLPAHVLVASGSLSTGRVSNAKQRHPQDSYSPSSCRSIRTKPPIPLARIHCRLYLYPQPEVAGYVNYPRPITLISHSVLTTAMQMKDMLTAIARMAPL